MTDPIAVSHLKSLPPEVLRLVLNELAEEDLYSLRLTCKALSYLATPLVFEQLNVWLEEHSLQSLVNVASECGLRVHVKAVSISLEYFYDIDYDMFKEHIYNGLVWNAEVKKFVNTELDVTKCQDTWDVYCQYLEKQGGLEKSGLDIAMLTYALGAFESLESISLTDHQDVEHGVRPLKLLRKEGLLRHWMLALPVGNVDVPKGGRQLKVLLRALSIVRTKPEELFLYIDTNIMGEEGLFSPLSVDDRRLAISAFSKLKCLTLLVPLACTVASPPPKSSLTTILIAATELESLSIMFQHVNQPTGGDPWMDIIQAHPFGKLRTLSIVSAAVSEAGFTTFLVEACHSLRVLQLEEMSIVNGSWTRTFEAIRGLKNLGEVYLNKLNYSDERGVCRTFNNDDAASHNTLYDYLLRNSDTNPWESMCRAQSEKVKEEAAVATS